MQQVLAHQNLLRRLILASSKCNADEVDTDKLENVPSNIRNLRSKVDKLVPLPVELSKLSDVVKDDVVKKNAYNAQIKDIED